MRYFDSPAPLKVERKDESFLCLRKLQAGFADVFIVQKRTQRASLVVGLGMMGLLSGCPAELQELCQEKPPVDFGRSVASLTQLDFALERRESQRWADFAEDRLKRTQAFLRPARSLENSIEVRSLLHTQASAWVAFLNQVETGKFRQAQATLMEAREREERLAMLLCPKR